jgi:PhzF family phenazine biosynthesis protein
MQAVASEMNLSETAFLLNKEDGYKLRWFTPKMEVDLCGHATLASAHTLWSECRVPGEQPIKFHTNSGILQARSKANLIELDFPSDPPTEVVPPAGLLDALGVSARRVARGRFDFLVEVDSEETLRSMAPDFARLGQIEVRGVIVSSTSAAPQYDFVSRFFAPWAGINEDPVTGSAHCCLGPYWRDRLGKQEFVAFQASARGGVVHVRVSDDRVILGGQAVTVLRGTICDAAHPDL